MLYFAEFTNTTVAFFVVSFSVGVNLPSQARKAGIVGKHCRIFCTVFLWGHAAESGAEVRLKEEEVRRLDDQLAAAREDASPPVRTLRSRKRSA